MVYREEKTIEAATFLLQALGGEMPYIKLIKLLYLADRAQIRRQGHSITGDTHWSLAYGPILSDTLNALKSKELPTTWSRHVHVDLEARVVSLVGSPRIAKLSRAEVEILTAVAAEHGHLPWEELVEITHSFPEWKKPVGKAKRTRIYFADIAKAVGHSDLEIAKYDLANRERAEMQAMANEYRSETHA